MNKSETTLADFVAGLISPVLIMTLVGSLAFFLIEVAYTGQFETRMHWFFTFFIIGAVLVSRISMQSDIAGRAIMYAVALGGAMWAALTLFLQFAPGTTAAEFSWAINLGLVVIILWSAYRLTKDSTLEFHEDEVSGQGLLDAAGLDQNQDPAQDHLAEDDEPKASRKKKNRDGALTQWWKRYQQYTEEKRRRPRTHGVWIVWFSLAALPMFGIGQAVIPAADTSRRQYAFWLLCIYVASGLGLLLTTTFLGLRRYLRQKKVKMPVSITGVWLIWGAGLIVVLLVVGWLLPRPNPEHSVLQSLLKINSPKRKPSDYAMLKDDAAKDKAQSNGSKNGKGKPSSSNKNGSKAGKGQNDKAGKTGQGKSTANQSQTKNKGKGQSNKSKDSKAGKNGDEANSKNDQSESKSSWQFAMPQWLRTVSPILKWIVIGLIGIVVLLFVLRNALRFLANFTNWAGALLSWLQGLWEGLWTKSGDRSQKTKEEETRKEYVRPFSTFRDPFLTGGAGQMSQIELLHYSFEALQAWARENNMPRTDDETPLEFSDRLGRKISYLKKDLRRVMKYYTAAAYAPHLFDHECEEALRTFWLALTDAAGQQLLEEAS